jgi:hypothetical protein
MSAQYNIFHCKTACLFRIDLTHHRFEIPVYKFVLMHIPESSDGLADYQSRLRLAAAFAVNMLMQAAVFHILHCNIDVGWVIEPAKALHKKAIVLLKNQNQD